MVDTTKETKPEAAPETKVEDTKDAKKDEKKVVEEKPHGSADNITKYKVRVRTQFFGADRLRACRGQRTS
jgi:hypothetical protein